MARFFLQKFIIFNMTTDWFLVEKQGTLNVRRYICKSLLTLDCQKSIRFGIFRLTYK